MLEKVGQAAMLKMFPTRCTRPTLHSVNTWSTLVNNKVHQAWCLKSLVKQPCWRCVLLVVLDRLCTVLTLEAQWWRTRYQAWCLKRLVKQPCWKCFPLVVLNRHCTVLTLEAHWWRARYTKLDAWKGWSSSHVENVSYSLYWTTLHSVNTWSTMVKSKVHSAWRLKRLVKQPCLKMFPTRCTRQTLHSVNTWSTMVKSKVHEAWRLKRLVKQPCWKCFPLVVLNRHCTVLTLEAHWWRARYTKLDAWKGWSSNHAWKCFLLVVLDDFAQC